MAFWYAGADREVRLAMSPVSSSKKDKERYYFREFQDIYPTPEGRIVDGDEQERPDIVIDGPRKIGIEITNFYLQPGEVSESEQRQRQYRSKIVAEAQKFYREGGGRNIEQAFSFDKERPIDPSGQKGIARKLAHLAKRIDRRPSGNIEKSSFSECPPEVASVYVSDREYLDAKWRVMQVHSADFMSKGRLETIIRIRNQQQAIMRRAMPIGFS
jgi:hypothetical protein